MIRERIAIVPEERALVIYRFWLCLDCGLSFSILAQQEPTACPRCLQPFGDAVLRGGRTIDCPCCGVEKSVEPKCSHCNYPDCGHYHT